MPRLNDRKDYMRQWRKKHRKQIKDYKRKYYRKMKRQNPRYLKQQYAKRKARGIVQMAFGVNGKFRNQVRRQARKQDGTMIGLMRHALSKVYRLRY